MELTGIEKVAEMYATKVEMRLLNEKMGTPVREREEIEEQMLLFVCRELDVDCSAIRAKIREQVGEI